MYVASAIAFVPLVS